MTREQAKVVNKSGSVMVAGTAGSPDIYYDRWGVFGMNPPLSSWYSGSLIALKNIGVDSIMAVRDVTYPAVLCQSLPGLAATYGIRWDGVVDVDPLDTGNME